MAAIGPAPPTPPKSPPLETIPKDIKGMILKCLDVESEINLSVIDAIWQKFVMQPLFWNQAADKLKIKVDPKNPKQGVIEYCQYHPINEMVIQFLQSIQPLDADTQRQLDACTTEVEKYPIVLAALLRDRIFFPILLSNILSKEPTSTDLRIARKLIKDMGEYGCNGISAIQSVAYAPFSNLELFQLIVDIQKTSWYAADNFSKALGPLAMGPWSTPFLQILINAGARPDVDSLVAASAGSPFDSHFLLIVDYCDDTIRAAAIKRLSELHDNARDDPLSGETKEKQQMHYFFRITAIELAPPPNFGTKK